MSMEYIRRTYGVPAKRGMTVTILGDGARIPARIVGSHGQYLRLWIAGGRRSHLYHPTDALEYPTPSHPGAQPGQQAAGREGQP